jgi:hypothetical protein
MQSTVGGGERTMPDEASDRLLWVNSSFISLGVGPPTPNFCRACIGERDATSALIAARNSYPSEGYLSEPQRR